MTPREAFERTPYHRLLGLRVEELDADRVRLRLPYADGNSNPGGALHGGVAASTIAAAGALAGWSGLRGDPDPATLDGAPVDVFVDYLSAAVNEDVVADARVLRRGKELSYVEVDVHTDAGKAIARGLVTYRIAPPGPPARDRATHRPPDLSLAVVPPFARFFTSAPFMSRLGIAAAHAADGVARTTLPFDAAVAGGAGALHDGALIALADTTAAMAAWSLVPLDPRNKASTVDLHVSVCGAAPGEALVAVAETLQRRNEIFITSVTVTAAASARVLAAGAVTYRIVVPEE